jgi:hypothetical protein
MTNAQLVARLTAENGEPETLPSGSLYWSGVAMFDPVSLMAESWYVDFGVITKGLSAADAWALMTQQGDQ